MLHEPITFTRQTIPLEAPGQVYSNGAFDEDGCLWITSTKGLYRFDSGQWHRYDEKDGLRSASVSPIAIANGAVWVSYRSPLGLTRISDPHGHWSVSHFDTQHGLPSDMVYALDARGGAVWAATDSGVVEFRGTDWTRYTQIDGMVWDDCDTNGILADETGVWIGTSRGLSHFMPGRAAASREALRAPFLKYVGEVRNAESGHELVLPWAERNFSIAWDSVNYREEGRANYQFRLEWHRFAMDHHQRNGNELFQFAGRGVPV